MIGKTRKFLLISLSCMILLCIAVFTWIVSFMSRKSEGAISEVGMIYMSEMSTQYQQKFSAIVELWLSQVEGIVRRTPPETTDYGESMLEELALGASVRTFEYMGLYTEDGDSEVIYGEPIEIIDQEEFIEALSNSKKRLSSGFASDGEKLLILIVDAKYQMA